MLVLEKSKNIVSNLKPSEKKFTNSNADFVFEKITNSKKFPMISSTKFRRNILKVYPLELYDMQILN